MSTHTQFVNVLQNKKQSVVTTKQNVLNRVTAAKQRILSPVTVIPTYDDVEAVSYDDALTSPEMYDNVYTEGTQPYQQPPVEFENGNVRKHTDGTFSVIESDGYIHNFGSNEQTARSYGAYTIAKDKAFREDAPDPGSIGDVVNRLGQGLVGIGASGVKGVIGTGTLRDEIDEYNKGEVAPTPLVTALRAFAGTQAPRITEEDENRFANVNQLNPVEQRLYRESPKFKILTELKNKAIETKANLDVAEENIASVNEYMPVDRAVEAARSAEFKYVAEADGLWEATKHTLGDDWASYLYGGVDAIPYMVILATGNVPVIASVVTSMALGNNVDNTQEFLKLNNGVEPNKDEAARILMFSVTQAAVDAIGDRLAVVGLPKGVATALSAQLISAKKILSSTAKSVPPLLNNFVTRTALKGVILPAKSILTEAPAGALEETSRQFATEGKISDPAAIAEAAIIEGFAAPVGGAGTKGAIGLGKAVIGIGKKIVGTKEEVVTETGPIIPPTYGEDGADPEFHTLIASVEGTSESVKKDLGILAKIGRKENKLTGKQNEIHKAKLIELKNKLNNVAADPKLTDGVGTIGNIDKLTEKDIVELNKILTDISDTEYVETIPNVSATKKIAVANTDTVSKQAREGTDVGWKGADTHFAEIAAKIKELLSPNADPALIEKQILTITTELQTHSGNLERKKEAFTEADSFVGGNSKIPASADLKVNDAITDANGEVKPRVGTGTSGNAIVIGTTNISTSYTVYYDQSESEIAAAKKEHPGYVTVVVATDTGSSINRLLVSVTSDSDYVSAVVTTTSAYLKSTIYADTKNKIEELKSDQAQVAALASTAPVTFIDEASKEDIDNLNAAPPVAATENVVNTEGQGAPRYNFDTTNFNKLDVELQNFIEILSNRELFDLYEDQLEEMFNKLSNKNKEWLSKSATKRYKNIEDFKYSDIAGINSTVNTENIFYYMQTGSVLAQEVQKTIDNSEPYLKQQEFVKENIDFLNNFHKLSEEAQKELKKDFEKIKEKDKYLKDQFLDEYDVEQNLLKEAGFKEEGLFTRTAQESNAEESAQIAADTKEEDTASETTQIEENVTEEAVTTTEVPTESSSAEIRAEMVALNLKLEEAEAREAAEAEAAEQKTAPVDTATEESTPPAAAETSDVADTVVEKTITYNPKGKDTQTYTIKGSKIFNANNVEVFKEDSVDRNKIFANLALKEKRAQLVEHEGKKYVVNDKQQIMSVATGNLMEWAENNGNRKAILALAQPAPQSIQESNEVSYKVENSNFSLQESELDVHTLSVLFPAAINADGTLKTGDTADAAVNKLGKFLKVCE